ncbi:hypothetical protein GOODEAATRI_028664 [Goodea atripinnis]|uniref:Uncharacterized protein n=1 Tax=Goodea atripinnis TaxID=208336 RepID=A0ABV0PHY7_9TELE
MRFILQEKVPEKFLLALNVVTHGWGSNTTPTVNSVGGALLLSPEALDGLPKSLRVRPVVLLYGLTNSSHAVDFSSATARATARFTSRYPSAASRVPQADQSR